MMKRKVSMLLLALAIALSFSFAGTESLFAASADSFGAGVTKAAPSDITKAGTPAAGALKDRAVRAGSAKIAAAAKNVGGGSTSFLPENTAVGINYGSSYNYCDTWFRIKPSHSGYITVSQYSSGNIQLCNSRKGGLSDSVYVSAQSATSYMKYVTFGVKAKTTYYLKVSSGGTYINGIYANSVQYKSTSFDGKYGKSKKKAARLKKNKKRKGYILSNGGSKYYKFSKKSRKVKIYIDGTTDETLKVVVTAKAKGFFKYKRTIYMNRSANGYNGNVLTLSTKGKKRTISVNVKVSRLGNSSGAYQLRYK